MTGGEKAGRLWGFSVCCFWQASSVPFYIPHLIWRCSLSLDRAASGSQTQQCSATSPQQLSSFSVQRAGEGAGGSRQI